MVAMICSFLLCLIVFLIVFCVTFEYRNNGERGFRRIATFGVRFCFVCLFVCLFVRHFPHASRALLE